MMKIGDSLVDGVWVPVTGPETTAINPATREPLATVQLGTAADVDAAVAAAHRAFASWSTTSIEERAAILYRLRDRLRDHTEQFAKIIASEIGSPLWFTRRIGMTLPIRNIELAIEGAEELLGDRRAGSSVIVREPYGVVAAITPWNAPVHQIVAKIAAALAAGCTVVLKPSEIAPQTARLFAEVMLDARIPKGVFNMVIGGADVGEALVSHPLVDLVSFTGSLEVGKRVAASAAASVKKVLLELGGKSATIVLADADLEKVAEIVPALCFANSGQVCVAQSRLLVPRDLVPRMEELLANSVSSWTVGSPFDETARLGPVATAQQYERVQKFIQHGIDEGAKLIAGGPDRAGELPGYYIAPTVFSEVSPDMVIAQEEIFGPVLVVMAYDSIDEAVEIANSVPLGLSGGVWSSDIPRAQHVARRMRTGQVSINGAPQNLATPFGGYKQSGYGRENGKYGVEEFLQYKAIHGLPEPQ